MTQCRLACARWYKTGIRTVGKPDEHKDTMIGRLVRGALDVGEGEGKVLVLSFVYFFCLLSSYYILRPLRDEMGIASGVGTLQWLFGGTFFVMLAAVPAYGWIVARYPRRIFVPLVYRFFILNIVIFYGLLTLDEGRAHVARAFFIWVSVFNLFVVSVFWSYMADLFRNEQGRRLFGFIAAGGSAGALAGPSLTILLVDMIGPVTLLLVSAGFLEVAVQCVRRLARNIPGRSDNVSPDEVIGGRPFAGLTEVARSPYLLKVSAYIVMISTLGTFLYFTQANIVAGAFDDSAERTRLFAAIDLSVNLLTILVQVSLTGKLIRRFGVPSALAFLPLVTIAGFAALAVAPIVAVIVAVQAVQRAANFAISNPAREILFTVVSREHKYKCKNVADTVVFRGADMAAGFAFAGLKGAGLELSAIAVVGAAIAALWVPLALHLGRAQDRLAAVGETAS